MMRLAGDTYQVGRYLVIHERFCMCPAPVQIRLVEYMPNNGSHPGAHKHPEAALPCSLIPGIISPCILPLVRVGGYPSLFSDFVSARASCR
jgi:hypothetical protein